MTEREVAVLIALLPMIILTSWAIRILIGSDQKDQIERSDQRIRSKDQIKGSDQIPVKVREHKRKKDQ